jgi:DNA recombination protein RmuC
MFWLIICLQAITILTLLLLFFAQRSKVNEASLANVRDSLSRLDVKTDRTEQAIRSGIQELRTEAANHSQSARDESAKSFRNLREEILAGLTAIGTQLTTSLNEFRQGNAASGDALRDTVISQIDKFSKTLDRFIKDENEHQTALREVLNTKLSLFQRDTADTLKGMQGQLSEQGLQMKDSVTGTLTHLGAELRENAAQLTNEVKGRLEDVSKQVATLSDTNEKKQDSLRQAVEQRMDKLSESNSKKLEEMRQTVDEKLHSTLEKRLTESFGLVTDQLGKVQLGLGEMKDLAIGVGDLKRVLTNVKVRGGFAEVQLGMQLEQMLAPDQYLANARIRPDSQETVEYAIRLPHEDHEELLLPIDAKFPKEDWERLEDAQQRGDTEEIEMMARNFEAAIRLEARKISEKYIWPPATTNFAIMFLPTEGLFAEVIRRPGLIDDLQTKHRICVCGPTTFMALLTALQMGFKTLAIQKKGNEVWNVLARTKIEFEKFGGLMSKVEKQVQTVQNTLGHISGKTKTISRTLRTVETLEASTLGSFDVLELEGSERTPGMENVA